MAIASEDRKQSPSTALQVTRRQLYEQVSSTLGWQCRILQEVTRTLQIIELEIRIALRKDK